VTSLKAGAWSAGFSAFKLLPVLAWIHEFPDDSYIPSSATFFYWVDMYLRCHLHGARVLPVQSGGWHEYGAYLGPVVLALAVIALAQVKQRRVRVLLLATVAAALIASAGPLLEPVFDVLTWLPRSNVARIGLFSVFGAVVLAGFGLDALRRQHGGAGRYLAPAVVGLAALDLMTLAYPLSEQAFVVPAVVPQLAPAPPPIAYLLETNTVRIRQHDENRSYAAALAGYGTLSYRPPLAPSLGVAAGSVPYLTTEPASTTATLDFWSPNRVVVTSTAETESVITLNSNYARGWSVNGQAAESHGGRLGVLVPAGEHTLTFVYRPDGYRAGLIITAVTFLLAVIVFVRYTKRTYL
jgi:hypothetical protein